MADMPNLVDMKYSKAEMKEEAAEAKVGPDGQPDAYPWGLCITLEKAQLDKLGVTELPQVGAGVHFMAVAKVTSVNQSASMGQDEETRVGLQITMLQILLMESAEEEAGEKETPALEARETKAARKGGVMGY
jgi:hypothetical protein